MRETANDARKFRYTSRVLKTASISYAVAALTLAIAAHGHQQQTTNTRANWPCGARIDPSYFHVAEGTGGQLLLLAPSEILTSAELSTAFDKHPETIFRLGGMMNPGVHDFRVPIDGSVESAMFSFSVQCLQAAEVLRPSGAPAVGEGVTDLSNFVATRMLIVSKPEPGVWTLRVSGTGLAGVMAKARSAVHVADVEFARAGATEFRTLPSAGVENVVRIRVRGRVDRLEGALVDAASKEIAPLPLEPTGQDGLYQSRFSPVAEGFRVMIKGSGDDGWPLQRVYAPLFTAR